MVLWSDLYMSTNHSLVGPQRYHGPLALLSWDISFTNKHDVALVFDASSRSLLSMPPALRFPVFSPRGFDVILHSASV